MALLVTLDSPDNVDESCAMIDTGAKAAVTNLLHLLHRPTFHNKKNPCSAKLHGVTAKNVLITPVAKDFLGIPAITLPGWTEVECQCSPQFTATLLNEQHLLKAKGRKSDQHGLMVNKLFDKHLDQLQHTVQKGLLQVEKDFNTNTGMVVVTCNHKQMCQKDLVITGVLTLGMAHTHPLILPMLPQSHPLSTN